MGLGGLRKFGEVWAAEGKYERETKRIARNVFQLPRPGMEGIDMAGPFDFELLGEEVLTGFEDLVGLDYVNLLDQGLQSQ